MQSKHPLESKKQPAFWPKPFELPHLIISLLLILEEVASLREYLPWDNNCSTMIYKSMSCVIDLISSDNVLYSFASRDTRKWYNAIWPPLVPYEMDCMSCISPNPLISRHTIILPLKVLLFGIICIHMMILYCGLGTTWCYKKARYCMRMWRGKKWQRSRVLRTRMMRENEWGAGCAWKRPNKKARYHVRMWSSKDSEVAKKRQRSTGPRTRTMQEYERGVGTGMIWAMGTT